MMKNRYLKTLLCAVVLCGATGEVASQITTESFVHPPQKSQPWVYWMWLNGNISKESITKDLEAMQRLQALKRRPGRASHAPSPTV